jgi:hypothetical protein
MLAPPIASAGPFLGDFGWCWRQGPDCPRGTYSPHHYWSTEFFRARALVRPVYLDQYPPGPHPPVEPTFNFRNYPCPSTPPAPTAPYADPAGYYGRP